MNRVIKFRAWDGDKMEYNVRIYWDATNLDECFEDGSRTWMQFTGLLDKNGKEIYEGDIVEWTDGTGERATIEWFDGDAMFEENKVLNGLAHSHQHYTIIGNIYENPELLSQDSRGGTEGNV